MLLDYIGVEPNPARDPKVKLPKRVTEEAKRPLDEHFLAIIETLLPRWRLFFITIEQGGLRIGEAAALRWGDVDVSGSRLRLPRSATKTSRWVQLPKWLMEAIEEACALEDRVPDRKVFQGFQVSAARQAMTRACRGAKIPHYSPLTISGIVGSPSGTSRASCTRARGACRTSKPSMSLDVYTHVMPVAEVETKRVVSLLTDA